MVWFVFREFATVVERLHCYFVIFRVLFNISEYGEGNIKEEKKRNKQSPFSENVFNELATKKFESVEKVLLCSLLTNEFS